MQKQVFAYTDGACKGNPGPGGWGVLLECEGTEKELWGGELETTNNRMEIMAAIQALESLTKPATIEIVTDSQYVMKGITEWLPNWIKRNWKTAANKPVKNADLWLRLQTASQKHKVSWSWVRGHQGHEGNERADCLANRGVDDILNQS
ncbi:MAG: ribonuclease HI [Gammaproteobacteria bacterium]|nr:ribonuclease HI [Gammaproteobacteria bacterium]